MLFGGVMVVSLLVVLFIVLLAIVFPLIVTAFPDGLELLLMVLFAG